jgi:hypothetical protein
VDLGSPELTTPDFEPVRDREDEMPQHLDPMALTDYEVYLRRVLPRFVRSDLEMVVNSEIQPIEEQLRGRIMQVIEEAQNRAFLGYRAMLDMDPGTQSPPGRISAIEFEDSQQTPLETLSQSQLRTMDAEPSSNTDHSEIHPNNIDCNSSSDSGYISNTSRPTLPEDIPSGSNSGEILGRSSTQHEAITNSEGVLGTGLAQPISTEDNTTVALPQRFQNTDDPGFGEVSGMQEGYSTDEPLLFDENWASKLDDLGMNWLEDATLW